VPEQRREHRARSEQGPGRAEHDADAHRQRRDQEREPHVHDNPATLSAPDTVSGSAAGCPNANWKGVNPDLTVTSIELSISQAGSTFYDCTVSNPNGLSGKVAFPASC
jgi:hypothetical protein